MGDGCEGTGIRAVLFDFGGVVADEGFVETMTGLARKSGIDPLALIDIALETSYAIGFSSGKVREEDYWPLFLEKTGVDAEAETIREDILSGYRLRPWVLSLVAELKSKGVLVCILSDHSHWLDELDSRMDFFRHFDRVFNSYDLGITKKDPAIFDMVLERIGTRPVETLFVDDHLPNVRRAGVKGLRTIHFTGKEPLLRELSGYFPCLDDAERS